MFKVKDHAAILHADLMQGICKPLETLGITYFSHVHIDNEHQFSGMGLSPEFATHYINQKYYKFDIHMASLSNTEQFIIWDTINRSAASKSMHDDFAAHGYGHTFTVIQPASQGTDYYHFATAIGNTAINQQNVNQLDLLQKFILYFRDKVNSIKELKAGYQQKLLLPTEEGGYFTEGQLMQAKRDQFLAQMEIHRAVISDDTHLTLKELECLHWHSLGKTADEVALIMGITDRTVKSHIRNLKDKLNCRNQFQLGLAYSRLKHHFEFS